MIKGFGTYVGALCIFAAGLSGCLDDPKRGPQTVIETGYLSCEIDLDSCGANAAACVDGDAVSACVETPHACNGEITCACFGVAACGSRECTDSGDGQSLKCADDTPDPNACTPGETFAHVDGCNTCVCPTSGRRDQGECTLTACAGPTCEGCLANGGTWQPEATQCTENCALQDISCFRDACPGRCEDGCGDCFSKNACEAQDCQWNQEAEAAWCTDAAMTGDCPLVHIVVQEGEEVIPGTTLSLSGTDSSGQVIDGATYRWSVDQPVGSQSVFVPSATVLSPRFRVNVAGVYVFRLDVIDANGVDCGEQATAQVVVSPDVRLHIELVWDTPGDLDQTDEGPTAGSDLDLHLAHPLASQPDLDGNGSPDPWFDPFYDLFALSVTESWWDAGDPPRGVISREDTDGAGPESINVNGPLDDGTYRLGVHYWNDASFGVSFAQVRVYDYGALVLTTPAQMLNNRDMWCAAAITVSGEMVTVAPCAEADITVAPNYEHPAYTDPVAP